MSQWITVARTQDLPVGSSKTIDANGHGPIAVFNVNGRYFAISDCCPHAGGPLSEGYVENGQVTCPWHGWSFRLESGKTSDDGLPRYNVQVDGDEIKVELP